MSRQPFRKAEPTAFESFRRALVGRAKPVADEARVEWFDRISGMVSTVFPEQEVRSNKPGLSFKLFFFEVALPGAEQGDLEEAARELAGTWDANMPDGVKAAHVNTYEDRKDLMFEFVFDLGETYVTGVVKLRCNSFGPARDAREPRGRRFESREGSEGGEALAEGSAEGDGGEEPRAARRFDEDGNEKSGEFRQGRRDRHYNDRKGGGKFDRGGSGGGRHGGDRDRGGDRDNRGGGGYRGDRDSRGGGGYGDRGRGGYGGGSGGGRYGGGSGGDRGGNGRFGGGRDDRPRRFDGGGEGRRYDGGGDRPRNFDGGDRPRRFDGEGGGRRYEGGGGERRDFGDRGGSGGGGGYRGGSGGGGYRGGSGGGFGGGKKFGKPGGKFGKPGGKFGKPGGGFKKRFDDNGGRPRRDED